jgi:hypothetical protein
MLLAFKLETRLVTVRTHNEILKTLNLDTMRHIKDFFWPKHFQNSPETYPGAGGYRYSKRTDAYQRQKFRKFGHNRPLVYTGALERAVSGSAKISGTSRGATLRARSPHFLRLKNRLEIEAVSEREKHELTARYQREYIRMCRFPEFQETRLRKPAAV